MNVKIICANEIYSSGLKTILLENNISSEYFEPQQGRTIDLIKSQLNSADTILLIDCDVLISCLEELFKSTLNASLRLVVLVENHAIHLISRLRLSQLRAVVPLNDGKEIIAGVKQAALNRVYIHPRFMTAFWNKGMDLKTKSAHPILNDREIQILELVFLEYSAKQIADKLFMSTRTVEWYKSKMLEKTCAKNVIGLIRYGLRYDLLNLNSRKAVG